MVAQDGNKGADRFFQIMFERSGGLFVVLESGNGAIAAGGYRVSMWNFSRQQSIDLVSHSDLDLNANCMGMCLLPV